MTSRRGLCYASIACAPTAVRGATVAATVFMLFSIAAFMAIPSRALSQTTDPTDQVHEIAKRLNCPTCAGRSLADCQTDTCTQWKQEIASQLGAGKSSEEVIDYFKARFGPTVLQEPPKEGVVLFLWVLPVLALIGFVAGVVVVLKRVTSHSTTEPTPARSNNEHGASDEYVRRVEEEVRKL